MGLDINVGLLSQLLTEDDEGAKFHEIVLSNLNSVLLEAGLEPHQEPQDLADSETFSVQSWGYGGLHFVRRLAAYLTLENRLPTVGVYEGIADDQVLEKFNVQHSGYLTRSERSGILSFLRKAPVKPAFEHLILHSDSEGFYLPRFLADVVFDQAQPQRGGLGAMIGSSLGLAAECDVLCKALEIPPDLDCEAEEVWENAESPPKAGELWQRYGVETFVLTRLRDACACSNRTGAAIVFT